jgi:hypothetical protein
LLPLLGISHVIEKKKKKKKKKNKKKKKKKKEKVTARFVQVIFFRPKCELFYILGHTNNLFNKCFVCRQEDSLVQRTTIPTFQPTFHNKLTRATKHASLITLTGTPRAFFAPLFFASLPAFPSRSSFFPHISPQNE